MFFLKKHNHKEDNKKNSFQNPKILEVNLIKDEVKVSFDWNKNLSVLIIVLFITGLFIAEIYFGLDWWEKQELSRAQAVNEDVARVSQEIGEMRENNAEALTYRDKALEVNNLLNNHVYWSNFFSWLEKNTLNTVKFSNFSGDLTGNYDLNAKASSFAEVSWQVKAFSDNPFTQSVEVIQASSANNKEEEVQDGGVSFDINLKISPDIFKK